MKHLLTILMLALCAGLPLTIQAQTVRQVYMPEQAATAEVGDDGLTKLHITDKLNSTPEAKAALADFQRRKAAGLLPRGKKSTSKVGETMFFKVINSQTNQLDDIEFEMVATDPNDPPRFQIWVEIAELESRTPDAPVTQAVIDSVTIAMASRTPEGSINPNAGIIENDEIIFGDPPDVDGDGISDVLILDIRDGFDEETNPVFLAGFVTQRDLSSAGNNRDVLYLDTDPTLTRRGIEEVEQTAVHEYQHLIMFNWDPEEIAFVNEGLSEWAEVALGYRGRPITYLNDPATYNIPLLRFVSSDSFDDRERGSMFINYIADQFGPLEAGKITRSTQEGSTGLRDALISMQAGISLEELIFNFHTANFFSDTGIDPRYGYTTEQRQGIFAVPGARFDGRVDSESPQTRVGINEGAVQYVLWEQVKDFTITLNGAVNAQNLRAELFLFGTDGSFLSANPLTLTGDAASFQGEFGRVVLVMVNVDPDGDFGSADYSAAWAEPEALVSLLTTRYDNGNVTRGSFFSLGGGADAVTSTRFVNPFPDRATQLDRIFLAPFFLNQFVDQNDNPIGTPNDPRDFTLYVWGPGGDGFPGDIILQMEMDDPRVYAPVTSLTINFLEIDMVPFASQLGTLPDTLYVGFGEAGEDDNNQVVGVSPYSVENVSYIGRLSDGAWTDLWDVQFTSSGPNEFPVRNTAIPIRARFSVPTATAVDGEAEVPEQIALYQNFPNPFNPTTSVRYSLPQAAEVHLAVYDLLGREVAVLVDGIETPGEHLVQINASQWASGVYFYTLQTAQQKLTQRMVLIK